MHLVDGDDGSYKNIFQITWLGCNCWDMFILICRSIDTRNGFGLLLCTILRRATIRFAL